MPTTDPNSSAHHYHRLPSPLGINHPHCANLYYIRIADTAGLSPLS
jgi:hypothetical protein